MNENEITVLKVEPGKAPEQITIPNTLKAMRELVGGRIEVADYQGACLVCNASGKPAEIRAESKGWTGRDHGNFFCGKPRSEW